MTFPTLPTYIPIADAARKYGYALDELKKMAQSGKINAVQLPDGDVIVSETSVKGNLANGLDFHMVERGKRRLYVFSCLPFVDFKAFPVV